MSTIKEVTVNPEKYLVLELKLDTLNLKITLGAYKEDPDNTLRLFMFIRKEDGTLSAPDINIRENMLFPGLYTVHFKESSK